MTPICGFNESWVGPCKGSTPCKKHQNEKCWCGAPATKDCPTAGTFVCGNPTCNDHECNWQGHGIFTPKGPHSERGFEQYTEWKKTKV